MLLYETEQLRTVWSGITALKFFLCSRSAAVCCVNKDKNIWASIKQYMLITNQPQSFEIYMTQKYLVDFWTQSIAVSGFESTLHPSKNKMLILRLNRIPTPLYFQSQMNDTAALTATAPLAPHFYSPPLVSSTSIPSYWVKRCNHSQPRPSTSVLFHITKCPPPSALSPSTLLLTYSTDLVWTRRASILLGSFWVMTEVLYLVWLHLV